jgi:integrase
LVVGLVERLVDCEAGLLNRLRRVSLDGRAGRRAIVNEIDDKGVYTKRNVAFGTVWTEFIGVGGKRNRPFKPSTVRDCTNIYGLYLEPFFGKHRIHEIQVAQIAAFKEHLRHQAVAKKNAKKPPKPPKRRMKRNAADFDRLVAEATAALPAPEEPVGKRRREAALLLLKSILTFAHDRGYIVSNPGKQFSVQKTDQRTHYIFSRTKAEALMAATDSFYQPLMMTLFYTGVRIGEAVSISWKDGELREDSTTADAIAVIHINRNVSAGELVSTGKSKAAHRDIPMPVKLVERLIQHREEQKERGFYKPDGLMFTNRKGRQINVDTFRSRVFRPARDAAGLQDTDCRIHDIRSTFITWMAENSIPSFLISRTAGHESASTTSGYIEARERQFKDIIDIFK